MPQLDKVTFLSQFFWLCITFFSLYLTLVKLFLPSLARIVKVRQALIGTTSGGEESPQMSKSSPLILAGSLDSSLTVFKDQALRLDTWSNTQFTTILPSISPEFHKTARELRTEGLLAENILQSVVPPVGRQQNLELSESHQQWFEGVINEKL